jgi:myogenesis-regulating glycosidase
MLQINVSFECSCCLSISNNSHAFQMFPALMKKKRKEDKNYKIKTFVCILFFIIVFLVGYAYTMYNQQILAKLYFDRIKFNTGSRDFRVLDEKGQELITGILGTTVHAEKPYQCLPKDRLDDGSVCLEWDKQLRLFFNLEATDSEALRCYSMRWLSLDDSKFPTDCFTIAGHWYGSWPMDSGDVQMAPFITGDGSDGKWSTALKRYFINSRGIAIQVDERTPFYLSLDTNKTNQFCLQARHDNFAFVNRLTPSQRPQLKYKICTADDMRILHNGMTQKSLWDGLKEKDIKQINSLLDEPVWQISTSDVDTLSESAIYNYTEDVIALGFLGLGHVFVNEYWQNEVGDFVLDTQRFPTLENTVDILHRRGFRISLTVQPFISTESPNFVEAVGKHLLIKERYSDHRNIPALTSYKKSASVGVLDITNNVTVPWLQNKLDKIVQDYKIDSFYLDFGTSADIPRFYSCSKTLANPDEYKTFFTSVLDGVVDIIAVNSAISVPRPPAFLSLPPVNSSWSGLQSLIPTVLSYGIIGYPFIMPGPVGGDFVQKVHTLSVFNVSETPMDAKKSLLPDQELYIRWLQVGTSE